MITGNTTDTTPTKQYFKFLRNDLTAGFADERWLGQGIWSEPKGSLSKYGDGSKDRLYYETLWVVAAEHDATNKILRAKLIRPVEEWNRKNQLLFATDCAERALPHWERFSPTSSLRRLIETVRNFAVGKATEQELVAAGGVSRATAWASADASLTATRATSWAANAIAALTDQTEQAERDWQINHLFTEYLKLNPNDFH